MRLPLLLSTVLLLTLAHSGLPAWAGDPGPSAELRQARQRIATLEATLRVVRVQSDSDKAWTQQLYGFVADCLKRLAEQERRTADVHKLQEELRRTHESLARVQAGRAQEVKALQQALAEQQARSAKEAAKAREAQQELERVRWTLTQRASAFSVARVLADIPASHWRSEARSKQALRARVALSVLGVLPDRGADTVEAILFAAHTHHDLLDRATPALVRIGGPAVPALVAAGCGEDKDFVLDGGWVMHVLGQMGAAAKDALSWLEEIAKGKGRKAEQARHAIELIESAGERVR